MKRRLQSLAVAGVLFSTILIAGLADASPPIDPPSLWVMDADGENHRRLMRYTPTHGPAIEWSPDSRYLVMESNEGLVVAVDGSGRRQLSQSGAGWVYYPKWSPDGSRVAFSREDGDFNMDIYTVDVESGETTRLTTHPRADSHPEWSPDGSRLAFARRGRTGGLFVMDADGTNVSRIIGGVYGQPEWSPDGSWVATSDGPETRDIWVAAVDGTQVANITHSGADELQISWSPDSERLAFQNYYKGSINVIDRDGTNKKVIFHRRSTGASSPMWSPDGERILFYADDIYTIRPDGRRLRNLTPEPWAGSQPIYSPDGESIAYLRN